MKKGLKIIILIIVVALIVSVFLIKRNDSSTSVAIDATTEEERTPLEYTTFSMEEFLAPGLPLMIDMGSASCGPCMQMKPDLEAFYEETYGKISVRYADVWKDGSLTGGFPAYAVPVQYFFLPDGSPYVPSEEVMESIGFYMYSRSDTEEHVLTGHYGILTKEQMYTIFRDMGVDV